MNEGIQPRPHIDRAYEDTPDGDGEEESRASLDDNEDLQKEIIGKIKKYNERGKQDRRAEVCNARDQRLAFRDIQYFSWNEDDQTIDFDGMDPNEEPYQRTFNIQQGYGKIFSATFMGARPKVRAEADDPFNPASIRNTSKAQTYERVYRKWNDTPTQQLRSSNLMWTDGRVVTRTVQRGDKQITEFHGVLESRLSITATEDIEIPLKNCPLIELENEFPLVQLKREYPDARSKINSGNGDSYERNQRTAVKRQAGSDTSIDISTGEDSTGMGTKTWSYMRPEFFEEFQESSRVQLEEMFPSGCCLIRNGDVYLASEECDVDGCLDVIHALPGDGQSRPSIGKTTMALQDSANVGQNLVEEIFDHAIPVEYYDQASNIESLNKQRNIPGQSRVMIRKAGEAASNSFHSTTPVQPSQQLLSYVESLKGPQAQFTSGQQPALFGGGQQDQKTASAYAQARNMALGQMAIIWKPYTAWFPREMTRAVRMASRLENEIKATLPASRRGGKPELAEIAPTDLLGLSFTNASDENFPETWTEKSNKVMSLLQMGGDVADWVLDEEPDNLYMLRELIGLEELVVPGEDMRNNVLDDIAQMEHESPDLDTSQMPEQPFPAMGQSAPQVPPTPSITIDTDILEAKDIEVGWKTAKHWLLGPAGQTAKTTNPNWYTNARLYALQYKKAMDANAQANQPAPPPDLPKVQIPYDSLPITGKIQAASKAGISLTPQDVQSVPPAPTGAANG